MYSIWCILGPTVSDRAISELPKPTPCKHSSLFAKPLGSAPPAGIATRASSAASGGAESQKPSLVDYLHPGGSSSCCIRTIAVHIISCSWASIGTSRHGKMPSNKDICAGNGWAFWPGSWPSAQPPHKEGKGTASQANPGRRGASWTCPSYRGGRVLTWQSSGKKSKNS